MMFARGSTLRRAVEELDPQRHDSLNMDLSATGCGSHCDGEHQEALTLTVNAMMCSIAAEVSLHARLVRMKDSSGVRSVEIM